jgi:hypothetical protein
MAKGKYLILILNFYIHSTLASPWLPREGQFIHSISTDIIDQGALKLLQQESLLYYAIEQKIALVEQSKMRYLNDPNLTQEALEHRLKEVSDIKQNLKQIQGEYPSFYATKTTVQSLEYGASDKYSLSFKAISQSLENFLGKERSSNGFEASLKFKIRETKRYVVALEPVVAIYNKSAESDDLMLAMGLLFGEAKLYKFGKRFNAVELSYGIKRDSWIFRADYTSGIETKNGTLLMLQSYNTQRSMTHKVYAQTSREQFAIAKPIIMNNASKISQMTLQAAYFHECSLSARKVITQGVQLSLWINL